MKNEIQKYIDQFEEKYKLDDSCLHTLFKTYKDNVDIDWVIVKATTLNSLYTARVSKDDLHAIAAKIVDCKDFDEKLKTGSPDVFYLIADKSGEQKRNAHVFASKYCHFSNPKKYPLYDGRSRKSLAYIYKKEFPDKKFDPNSLFEYIYYRDRLNELLKQWGMDGEDRYKKIDEFLWTYADEVPKE